ncbi:MAG: hypothetical protein COA70_05070 [Planctomycetota bacterium]|nr:MAG: hypothetical protein COA70_05070 [Planctomycetota bacterium]
MDSTSAIAVPVLGMHRSGTSMVSRVLEAGGVAFGVGEDLAGPAADNQHGYWENLEIRQINEELLRRLGGDWRNPPGINNQALGGLEVEDLRVQATTCLEKLASTSKPCWSMKDPRMSLVLPFWQSLLRSPVRAVLCLRHPSAVADSLQKRNRISAQLAGFLWQEYMASACLALNGSEVLVVSYESMLSRTQVEVQRCIKFFGEFGVLLDSEAMMQSVDPSLNHAAPGSDSFAGWHPGGADLFDQLERCAHGDMAWNEIHATKPSRDPAFCSLMREAALLAEELDVKNNAYEDRVEEAVDARSAQRAAEESCASAVVARISAAAELEAERTRMDNLQKRLEVRLGSALRRTLRRSGDQPSS